MSTTDESRGEPLHPAYFQTRFRQEADQRTDWPEQFAIISAHATTGEQWSAEQNKTAHEALGHELERLDVWIASVTGYSPETGHAEPSYAAVLPLDEARALGRQFQQDAIFHVRGDELSLTRCHECSQVVPVGSFRERLDSVNEYGHSDAATDDDDPWPRISDERFRASIDARTASDHQHG
jgi:hypothetical protein